MLAAKSCIYYFWSFHLWNLNIWWLKPPTDTRRCCLVLLCLVLVHPCHSSWPSVLVGAQPTPGVVVGHRYSPSLLKEANLAVPQCQQFATYMDVHVVRMEVMARVLTRVAVLHLWLSVSLSPLPLFPKHEGMKIIQPEFIISVFRVEPLHHLLVWVPHSLQFSDFFLSFFQHKVAC